MLELPSLALGTKDYLIHSDRRSLFDRRIHNKIRGRRLGKLRLTARAFIF